MKFLCSVEAPIFWPPDAKELTLWKRSWCWERLRAGRERGDRGWDGWMASPAQWTWVWASSGRWWRTGKPGMLQSIGSQRVGHDWVTEQTTVVPTYTEHKHTDNFLCLQPVKQLEGRWSNKSRAHIKVPVSEMYNYWYITISQIYS